MDKKLLEMTVTANYATSLRRCIMILSSLKHLHQHLYGLHRQTADVTLQRHSSSDKRTNSDERGPKSLRNQNEVPLLVCVLVTLAGWIQTLVHDHLRQKIARRKNCFKINIETHDQWATAQLPLSREEIIWGRSRTQGHGKQLLIIPWKGCFHRTHKFTGHNLISLSG